MAKPCYHSIYQISYFWYLQLKLALSATASTHFNSVCRGVARILQRGFPLVVDPRRGGLGAQLPEADE